MAQINLTIIIPNDKVPEVLTAFERMQPIPQIHSIPGDPTSPLVPEFTRAQWPREWLRRQILKMILRYRHLQATTAAGDAVNTDDIEIT